MLLLLLHDPIRHDSMLMRANYEPENLAGRRLKVTACGSSGANAAVSCALTSSRGLESK